MCSAEDGSGKASAQQPGSGKASTQQLGSGQGESGYRSPGLRGVRTTSLFRAVNPELFIKPNKPMMVFGLVTISLCVGYLGYLHAIKENDQQLYEAVDSEERDTCGGKPPDGTE